jgi:hypothetical protein
LDNKPDSPLGKLLTELTEDVIKQLQDRLVARDINASLGLSQSIVPTDVFIEGNTVGVGISMDFYWKYVNYGVNGTEINRGAPNWGGAPQQSKTFLQAIREWIPQRGLTLPEGFTDYDSFAWAIMSNKRKKGQEARPFFTDVINESLVNVLKEPIERLLGRAVEISIVEPWQ